MNIVSIFDICMITHLLRLPTQGRTDSRSGPAASIHEMATRIPVIGTGAYSGRIHLLPGHWQPGPTGPGGFTTNPSTISLSPPQTGQRCSPPKSLDRTKFSRLLLYPLVPLRRSFPHHLTRRRPPPRLALPDSPLESFPAPLSSSFLLLSGSLVIVACSFTYAPAFPLLPGGEGKSVPAELLLGPCLHSPFSGPLRDPGLWFLLKWTRLVKQLERSAPKDEQHNKQQRPLRRRKPIPQDSARMYLSDHLGDRERQWEDHLPGGAGEKLPGPER